MSVMAASGAPVLNRPVLVTSFVPIVLQSFSAAAK